MKEKLVELIVLALRYQASDLHFVVQGIRVQVSLRGMDGIQELHSALIDRGLFNYLKYIAHLDLGNASKPQSGHFTLDVKDKRLFFRFSFIQTFDLETGVLRILNNHARLTLSDLTKNQQQLSVFESWTKRRSGMVLLSGPTGSGKTTTLHALLGNIAKRGKLKIITLEDPIEIQDERYLQLAINEASGFTYEEGIRQLLRHDPDVIMIGEIRDSYTAKMAYRCALTGHMVFSSVHARSAQETIKRLCELGLKREELLETLTGITAQRLYPSNLQKGERICIYEILHDENLQRCLREEPMHHHKDIQEEIKACAKQGDILLEQAISDL